MDYSIAISESTNEKLQKFLLDGKDTEEICFATWSPASGKSRLNILLDNIILPKKNDRVRKIGTVSALPCYLDRCKEEARGGKSGLTMIHTHPMGLGHQGVSESDLYYERDVLAREVFGITGQPFVGITLSGDGVWSGRIYPRSLDITWCSTVRIVGKNFEVNFNPYMNPVLKPNRKHIRTTSVWGENKQSKMMALKIGIVGVGSVGSAVGEILCRMGISHLHLMDYDIIKEHNLDRMNNVTKSDVGRLKIDVVSENLSRSATAENFHCTSSTNSVVEKEGFEEALDCDILFCCVDRPWPRQVLNHLAYSCLIPVIDGGIGFKIADRKLVHGMFRAQTVGVERACLDCLHALDTSKIQQDRDGLFDDSDYIIKGKNRDKDETRQSIMPFVFGLSSLETIQFVELVTNLAKRGDLGQQAYDYRCGTIISRINQCRDNCIYQKNIAQGNKAEPYLCTDMSRTRSNNSNFL